MGSESTIQFLLKFGTYENMKRLIEEGMLYARPVHDFKKNVEHKRYDHQEGLHKLHHMNNERLYLKEKEEDEWKYITVTTGKFNSFLDDKNVHSYSMYAITEKEAMENEFHAIPDEMKAFGECYVLVNKPRLFQERLAEAFKRCGLTWESGLVRYYDATVDQSNLNFFCKSRDYAVQREYRVIVQNDSSLPTSVFIGDLTDIAEILHVNQFKGFRFFWPELVDKK